jgi:CSLREA domain-containing protein
MRSIVTTTLAVAVFLLAGAEAKAGLPIVVNETGDENDATGGTGECDVSADVGAQCTLRGALQTANATLSSDAINFAIPGAGPHTIAPATPLPAVTAPVVINGYSQDGASPNTNGTFLPIDATLKVYLFGGDYTFGAEGLQFDPGSDGSIVRGLAIGGFPFAGIEANAPVTVQGCFIGTNVAGTKARPNLGGFLGDENAMNSTLGGPNFEDRNLISGNLAEGIVADAALIAEGNYIGVERDGKSPLPNGTEGNFSGVLLTSDDSDKIQRNLIANSSGPGISIPNANAGSLLSANRIFKNDGIGIDLGDDGVTPNDEGDADSGPNDLQNFPKITRAERTGTTTTIEGTLETVPNENFGIQIFQADGKSRQGRIYMGGVGGLNTGPEGEIEFFLEFAKPKKGKYVTATAIRAAGGDAGSTSEFAKPRKVK